MSDVASPLRVRVHSVTWEAEGIFSYEFRDPTGAPLPAFTAGSHIDLNLPTGLVRSYSLVNSQDERHRYLVAVQKDRASRGGSTWVHDKLKTGDIITISHPRNNFTLAEGAAQSLLIAGGIGVTPLWCMMQRLTALGRPVELIYCVRTRKEAAFREAIDAAGSKTNAKATFNFDGEPGGKMLDLAATVAAQSPDTHIYCCGPLPMLEAFEGATKELPRRARACRILHGEGRAGGRRRLHRGAGARRARPSRSRRAKPSSRPCSMPGSTSRHPASKACAAPARPRCSKAFPIIATSCSRITSARRTRR